MYSKGQPYVIDVAAGETKYICQCGKTSTPPYCDGSHQGSDYEPLEYTAMVYNKRGVYISWTTFKIKKNSNFIN